MIRKTLRLGVVTILAVGLLAGSLSQTACDQSDLDRIVSAVKAAGFDAAKIQQLVTEFKANPSAAALDAIDLAFDGAVAEASKITDPVRQTVALALLSVGEAALRRVIQKYLDKEAVAPAPQRQMASMHTARLREHSNRPQWRCRASGPLKFGDKDYGAGQFVPMGACKELPNITQVNTFRTF